MSTDIVTAGSRYGRSIVILLIIIATGVFGNGLIIAYTAFVSNQNQQQLLDCTDKRRANSDCQKLAAERTGSVATIINRYTLYANQCSVSQNSDRDIEKCVLNKINRAQASNTPPPDRP